MTVTSKRDFTTRSRDAVETCPARAARLAARRLTRYFDARLKKSGLGIAQFNLMTEIAGASDDTLGALALKAGLDPSTLTRNLQALAREGLVEIATVEKDQRRRGVWLTEAGLRKLATAFPLWQIAKDDLASVSNTDLALKLAAAMQDLGD